MCVVFMQELLEGTSGDAIYFTLTIILMIVYSVLVSTGGDAVGFSPTHPTAGLGLPLPVRF